MSRIGKRPVILPKEVTAKMEGDVLRVKGGKGELSLEISKLRYPAVRVAVSDGNVAVTRAEESRRGRTEQGLIRALIQNMVKGVSEGYSRELEVVGVGYKAEARGKLLVMSLGYSHPIEFALPEGIQAVVDKQTRIKISGADKQMVGEVASRIRRLRSPEPYKGKGVKYVDEVIKRKVGKTVAAAAPGAGAGG